MIRDDLSSEPTRWLKVGRLRGRWSRLSTMGDYCHCRTSDSKSRLALEPVGTELCRRAPAAVAKLVQIVGVWTPSTQTSPNVCTSGGPELHKMNLRISNHILFLAAYIHGCGGPSGAGSTEIIQWVITILVVAPLPLSVHCLADHDFFCVRLDFPIILIFDLNILSMTPSQNHTFPGLFNSKKKKIQPLVSTGDPTWMTGLTSNEILTNRLENKKHWVHHYLVLLHRSYLVRWFRSCPRNGLKDHLGGGPGLPHIILMSDTHSPAPDLDVHAALKRRIAVLKEEHHQLLGKITKTP